MQISNNSNAYDAAQLQRAMAGQQPPDADADGQTSPTAATPSGAPAAPQAPASPGAQFDASTLGGLIALQQEQQQQVQQQQQGQDATGGSWSSTGHAHRHHHGHGMHQAAGEGGSSDATSAADQTAAATTQGA